MPKQRAEAAMEEQMSKASAASTKMEREVTSTAKLLEKVEEVA